jgi:UDP-glucose 4-epimerase
MRRLKVALTGPLGILGGHLARHLELDDGCRRLLLLDLVPPPRALKKALYYRVDLTEAAASAKIAEALDRERVDVLVHAAFLQHPIRNAGYEHELESLGTMHILHALTQLGRHGAAPHLILASSTLVYGARAENPSFLSEDAPLAGRRDYPLVAEKIDAERQAERFHGQEGVAVTILRTAPILSPQVRTLASRYLSLPAAPTILGFNPMVQTVAIADATDAFARAILNADAVGPRGPLRVYNVCGDGVLPLHTAARLCGRRTVPLVRFAANAMVDALFETGLAIAPSAHLDYLQYPCVADGARARNELGFVPRQSTRDCMTSFARARVRDAA